MRTCPPKHPAAGNLRQVALLGALLSACGHLPTGGQEATGYPAADFRLPAAGGPPSMEQAMNATVAGIYARPVTLAAGAYRGEPFSRGGASRPDVRLDSGFDLVGDLDADGREERVVLLTENSGGSGSFSYLAVLERRGNGVVNVGTAAVGDRVQIRDFGIREGAIVLAVVQAGPGDAACCPAQLAERRWTLDRVGLRELPADVVGSLSRAVLAGVEWRLAGTVNPAGGIDPAPPGLTMTLSVSGDRVTGSGGCNRYDGRIAAGRMAGEIRLDSLATTRMHCGAGIMDAERRFLEALARTRRFSFHLGRLQLTGVDGDGRVETFRFTPGAQGEG